ncbi:hypothetical protein RO3G_10882 [Lichtheimia corymbifera JMRC:FSU:9682]|uniref:Protein PBN1 n=1 Tax=Lichtheimia corymbifera JMRC:FSU:9682 TaxID=1263082 RepID=A0A068S9R0_9FUNG|nr:hypothetical protein RO3G_10882 [Lichtheimia corymbifera JMRC:FSU:9682]
MVQSRLDKAQSLHPHIVTRLDPLPEPQPHCFFDVIYELPASVFVDPNQLSNLPSFQRHWVFGETDLEVPLEHVKETRGSVVIVRQKPTDIEHELDLPIHLRYQRPSDNDSFRDIKISAPRVGWTCPLQQQHPDDHGNVISISNNLPPIPEIAMIPSHHMDPNMYTFHPLEDNGTILKLQVPVGNTQDANMVQWGTALCVLACTSWIGWSVWRSIQKRRRYEAKGKRRKSE